MLVTVVQAVKRFVPTPAAVSCNGGMAALQGLGTCFRLQCQQNKQTGLHFFEEID